MATVMAVYVRNDVQRTRNMNVIMQLPDKKITYSVIDETRLSAIQRCIVEGDLEKDSIKDVVFMNWTYLGHMTEGEFNKGAPEEPAKKNPYEA